MNLTTNNVDQDVKKFSLAKSGITIILICLLLVGAVCAGLLLWKKSLNEKKIELEASYGEKYAELLKGRSPAVVDLQNRLSVSADLVKQGNVALDVLQSIEKSIVSGVYISSYKNNKNEKSLELKCVADDYGAIAKQVLNLKKINYFSNVTVRNIVLSNEGKNNFLIDIKLN